MMRCRMLGMAVFAAGVAGALVLGGCRESGEPSVQAGPAHDGVVRTASGPMAFIAQRVGGEGVRVEMLVPDDEDPASWSPAPEVVAAFQGSMLIVLNGAGFEAWAESAVLPMSRVVRTAEASEIALIDSGEVTHTHGPEGEHTHGEVNPHTWLEPSVLAQQAVAVRDALARERPDLADQFDVNLFQLQGELADLSAAWSAVDAQGVLLIASHPSYDYLARAHGWQLANVTLDPDAEMDALAAVRLSVALDEARQGDEQPVLVLWESEPMAETRKRLMEEFGARSVVIDPAEAGPIDAYLDRQRANVERFERALAEARGN